MPLDYINRLSARFTDLSIYGLMQVKGGRIEGEG